MDMSILKSGVFMIPLLLKPDSSGNGLGREVLKMLVTSPKEMKRMLLIEKE